MPPPANRHVALLRGINVGGRNKLPMRTLAGLLEQAGCTDVATYIQSGNVTGRRPWQQHPHGPGDARRATA